MRATYPIIMCDSEDGCDQWTTDEYTATVSNWQDFLNGWQYDPYDDNLPHLCPDHAPGGRWAS